ncbi:hypothetical protein DFP96_10748 [Listeria rocourtiae]|uniref:Cyclic nucleotide-binding domain-containing protein n=1 Tax=Listeria rocourtiae TaxID=647910 RepID=A0A4R6ZJR3_9LIST|nr:hypothetical protein DFP96_10748 [Listeria rocourtiae]
MRNLFYFTDLILFQKYAVLEKMSAGSSIELKQGLFIIDEGFISYEYTSKKGNETFFGVKDTILHITTKYIAQTDCILWHLPEIFVDIAKESEEVSRLLAYATNRENQWLKYLQSTNTKQMDPHFINLLRFEDIYRRDYDYSLKYE